MRKLLFLSLVAIAYRGAFAADADKCGSVFNPSRFFVEADDRARAAGVDTMKIKDLMAFYSKSELEKQASAEGSSIAKDKTESYANYMLSSVLGSAKDSLDTSGAYLVRVDSVWAKGSNNQFVQANNGGKGCRFWDNNNDYDIPINLAESNENTLVVLKGQYSEKQTFRKLSSSIFTEERETVDPKTGKKDKMVVVHKLLLDLEALNH